MPPVSRTQWAKLSGKVGNDRLGAACQRGTCRPEPWQAGQPIGEVFRAKGEQKERVHGEELDAWLHSAPLSTLAMTSI